MGLSVIVLIAMRKRWHVPPVWPPLALFMLGTLASLAASGHVRQGLPQVKKFFVYLMLFLVATAFRDLRQICWVIAVWSMTVAFLPRGRPKSQNQIGVGQALLPANPQFSRIA